MSVRLDSITIRNFLSVGNIAQTINIAVVGLTLVLGENADVGLGRQDSTNGVGKTTLLQAISYALFGEPLTKIKLDNCVNNINNKAMLVTIRFDVNGDSYVIERGRKPGVLRLSKNGSTNEAHGENRNTQAEIETIIGMSHTMFRHIVGLNTDTEPFVKLKASDQREVIEELLGITQLSQRAASLKEVMDLTKESLRDEDSRIKATIEANDRIQAAINRAMNDAEVWRQAHERTLRQLMAKADEISGIDVETEMSVFDQIDAWVANRKEYDDTLEMLSSDLRKKASETLRINQEIRRYREEAGRSDNGEIARLETQVKRYIAETEDDIAPQIVRLRTEASRRRKDADSKMASAEKLAADLIVLQEQIDAPDAHTCSTCGQGLVGTDHLSRVIGRLKNQSADLELQIQKAMADADQYKTEAKAIDLEIEQAAERSDTKRREARIKLESARKDIELTKERLVREKADAAERLEERLAAAAAVEKETADTEALVDELREMIESLGPKPYSRYPDRASVWKIKQDRDALVSQIEAEEAKPNVHVSKIEGLQSTLIDIDYDKINDLNLQLKHEAFLYKLLTAKDSFVRKKIIDQNLVYLNKRLNHYLEKLALPHEVRFMPDLTVEISLQGRDMDFEQLSGGERNRIVLSMGWAFRDVWESLNTDFNLVFVDELVDTRTDGMGAEAALQTLQGMARDRGKSVFLISHKENLIGRADRVMMVRKEDQFTTFTEDWSMAA